MMPKPRLPHPADADGFTLIELLTAMGLFLVVAAATLVLLTNSERLSRNDSEQVNATVEAQTALDRMIHELRGATNIVATSPNSIDVDINNIEVRYTCDVADTGPYRQCVRAQGAADSLAANATGTMVARRLINGTTARPVFTYTVPPTSEVDPEDEAADPTQPVDPPQPTYVTVSLVVPASGERQSGHTNEIIYNGGFYLRNLDYGRIQDAAP